MTYAEYLKANGATDAEVTVLDTPVGRRAFEKQQTELAEAVRTRDLAVTDRTNYQTWYETQAVPAFDKKETELAAAKANEARVAALVRERAKTDEGLREVAKTMGIEVDAPNTPPAASAGGTEISRAIEEFKKQVYTRDEILQIARAEGKAIATMGKIIQEHERLFPNTPIVDWEGIREQAESSKKPFEQVWMEKFNVADARAKALKAADDARIATIVAEQVKAKEAELISRFGNPDTRPLAASSSPFVLRPATGRDKQPWETDGNAMQNDRVQRATQRAIERGVSH